MNRLKNNIGFTLVELLVVMAIISLLAAMLMPALKTAQESSKSIVCLNNLRQIGQGLALYSNENDGYFPPVLTTSGPLIYWYTRLKTYIGANKGGNNANTYGGEIMVCPKSIKEYNVPAQNIARSYMATEAMRNAAWDVPIKADKHSQPSSTMICIDGLQSTTPNACFSAMPWVSAPSQVSYRHKKIADALYMDFHVGGIRSNELTSGIWQGQ